jgi:diamine N-acetyltransferase
MKFELRPVDVLDHEWLVELHNDPLVLKNNTDPRSITLTGHLDWWSKTIAGSDRNLRFIFTVDCERAGFAKFIDIDKANKNCYLGADIHSSFRGKGYAKELWTLMLDMCFYDLQLHRVALTTAEFNEVGLHIYKKLGFVEEGRFVQSLLRNGKYYDEILMYMLRDDWIWVPG